LTFLGEQSPNGSINSSINLKKINSIVNINNNANNNGNNKNVTSANIVNPKTTTTTTTTSSNLDQFFESLNVEELGSNKEEEEPLVDEKVDVKPIESIKKTSDNNHQISQIESKQIEYISAQLKLDTFKSKEAFLQHEKNKELKITLGDEQQPTENNLTETAANLEMSLKNSAELLKQISSIGKMEHLQQLEQQMHQSMQLIEKLKSASQNSITSQPLPPPPPPSPSPLLVQQTTSNNHINDLNRAMTNSSEENLHKQKSNNKLQQQHGTIKLRSINSMPANLKELEALIQNQQVIIESQSRFQNQTQSNKQLNQHQSQM
jgi:hypothetical protein